jgi:hypothetical protein
MADSPFVFWINSFLCVFDLQSVTMSRLLPILLLTLGWSAALVAQNSICRQVVASAGKTGQNGNRYFSYTVGEPVVFAGTSPTNKITQGFNQPELCALVSTNDVTLNAWNIEVFPVPTEQYLNIRFSAEKQGALRAAVFDAVGRLMYGPQQLDDPSLSRIDCADWAPGVYFLRLEATDAHAAATLRFVRL